MIKYLFREWWRLLRLHWGKVLLLNALLLASFGAAYLFSRLLLFNVLTFILALGAGIYCIHAVLGGISFFSIRALEVPDRQPADEGPGMKGGGTALKELIAGMKRTKGAALLLSLFTVLQLVLIVFVLPFYLSLDNLGGIIGLSLIFWGSLGWQLSSQYYFAAFLQLGVKPGKALTKSVVFFVDNFFFTIFMGLSTLLMLSLSGFTLLLFPGFCGAVLLHQTALKMRLLKYDYLEEHPDLSNKKAIPWDALLEPQDETE
jgi:hypothetical protein